MNSFYKYDEAGRLKQLTHTMATSAPTSGWGTGVKAGYQLAYDDASRIDSIYSYLDGGAYYGYDDGNQLTAVNHDYQNNESYAYDLNGNRSTSTIGLNNRLESDSYGSYTYDDEGNRTSRTEWATGHVTVYAYDHRNRLVGATDWISGPYPEETGEGTLWGWGESEEAGSTTVGPGIGQGTSWGWGPSSGQGTGWTSGVTISGSVTSATEGGDIVLTLTSNSSSPVNVSYMLSDVSTYRHFSAYWHSDFYVNQSQPNLWGGIVSVSSSGPTQITIHAHDDSLLENRESFQIGVQIVAAGESLFVLEADILDNDAQQATSVPFSAEVNGPVLEGNNLGLVVYGDTGTHFEWWVEDLPGGVSAVLGLDYSGYATSGQFTIGEYGYNNTVWFGTYDGPEFELRESFKIYVQVVGDPASEIVVEAGILDKDPPLYEAGSMAYGYDYANRLVATVFDPDGGGQQAAIPTYYSWEAGQIVLQFDGDTASDLSHRYLWNPVAVDQLLADEQVTSLSSAGTVLWPLADHLGTIRDLATHNSGITSIVNHRKYDSFGNLISETNAAIDEIFGYTGRLFDEATGLQYNLNRWYDAKSGRWTSEDPIGFADGPNPYTYVQNSPTNRLDPTGTITVTTLTKNPKTVWGSCLVDWKFELDAAAPAAGFIVQKVTYRREITDAAGITTSKSDGWWEAWEVEAGKKNEKGFESGKFTWTDGAREDEHRNTSGWMEQSGEVKFFVLTLNQLLAAGFRKGKVTEAGGDMYSTRTPPPWWGNSSSNGERSSERGVRTVWTCEPYSSKISVWPVEV